MSIKEFYMSKTILNMNNKHKIFYVLVVIIVMLSSINLAQAEPIKGKLTSSKILTNEISLKVKKAIEKVYPALVRIHVVYADYSEGREKKMEGSGSGIIISSEGYVVTNYHVAGKAKRIICTLANKVEVEATLVGVDALTDIAVIKLKIDTIKNKVPLKIASFGDSTKLQIGDIALAMGSPFALSQSVTMGIISNLQMIFPKFFWPFEFTLDDEDIGSIVIWIGHDAQIFPGNSGGPLVNLNGEIIGINEFALGLGGAIPSNIVKPTVTEIITYGMVRRSWIGIECQPLLKSFGEGQGVLVSGIIKDSPSDKAGIKSGDIILNFDGFDVNVSFDEDLPSFNRLIFDTPVGKEVKVKIKRNKQEQIITLSTKLRGKARDDEVEIKKWGMTALNLTDMIAVELKRKSKDGVLVGSIKLAGACDEAKPPIRKADIILQVADKNIKNLKDLQNITEELTTNKIESVPTLVVFERRVEKWTTVIKLGFKKEEDKTIAEARKNWLGVSFQALTPHLSEILNLKEKKGVVVTDVYKDSPAERSNLKVGDIIVGVDGEKIPVSQSEDAEVFATMIRHKKVGVKYELDIIRLDEISSKYKDMKIQVEFVKSPMPNTEMRKYEDKNFEFSVRDISFFDSRDKKLESDTKGVIVEAVLPGGWAALSRIAVKDIILLVDGKDVKDIESFKNFMEEIANKKQKQVVFFIKRGIHTMFIEVELLWQ